jgi:hypothetical protein
MTATCAVTFVAAGLEFGFVVRGLAISTGIVHKVLG